MSRQKPSQNFVSINLNDKSLGELVERLTERNEELVSGGGVNPKGSLFAPHGQISLSLYVHNDT